jgi:parvulin-like peptidyl-prolyl isomerase
VAREELVRKKIIQEALASGFDKSSQILVFMERAREQALADHFLSERSQAPDDFPAAPEIKAAYELNKEKYTTPQRVHLAQIFIKVPGGLEEKEKEALQVKAQKVTDLARREGSDFTNLAAEYSEHQATARSGGDLGWLEEGTLAQGMRQVLAGMAENTVSAPYHSQQGWHVFKLLGRESAFVRQLEEVAGEIREELRRQKMSENRDLYLRKLIEKDGITLDEARLQEKAATEASR